MNQLMELKEWLVSQHDTDARGMENLRGACAAWDKLEKKIDELIATEAAAEQCDLPEESSEIQEPGSAGSPGTATEHAADEAAAATADDEQAD